MKLIWSCGFVSLIQIKHKKLISTVWNILFLLFIPIFISRHRV